MLILGMIGFCGLCVLPTVQTPRKRGRHPCSNNLKQIALAFHWYHDKHGSFPPAYLKGEDGLPWHSWRIIILPYFEENRSNKDAIALYQAYRFDEPWNGPNNIRLAERMPHVYRCPDQPVGDPPSHTKYVLPVGNGTIWPGDSGVSFKDMTDGSSNLIAVMESDTSVHWLTPRDVSPDDVLSMLNDDKPPPHIEGRFVALGDGSVRYISDQILPDTMRRLLLRADGEPVGEY
jgi:hypothetical protein